MPELNGNKTLDLVVQELGVGEKKVRDAIEALKIEPTVFRVDQRFKYYRPEDIEKIKEWLFER